MSKADHWWSMSNPGPEKLAVWLEPWAEEVNVPVRSVITMEGTSGPDGSALSELEWTPNHLTVWANVSTMRVSIDGMVQDTCSAVISMPAGLTKAMLNVLFASQPMARLGGANASAIGRQTWQSKLRRRFGFPRL